MAVASSRGRHFEIEGRAVAGRAVMRIRDVSGDRLQLVRLRESHTELLDELDALRAMLDAIPHPVWTRDADGRLAWANAAYVARRRGEGLDRRRRPLARTVRRRCARGGPCRARRRPESGASARRPSRRASARCTRSSTSPSRNGSAGMASDLSELTALRGELERQIESHARTLDQLSTAVAIFDRSKRLIFYNAAYRQIWSLDPAFLDQQPSDGEVLDRLRAKRQLPEQADFRAWKAQLQEAYQAIESGRKRLVSARRAHLARRRQPQSARRRDLSLRRRHPALQSRIAIQCADPRAGRDARHAEGRRRGVRHRRAAEARQPGLRRALALRSGAAPPTSRISTRWRNSARRWSTIPRSGRRCARSSSACPRSGATYEARIERKDGLVLDCAAMPLPDGATLLTFLDVTASVNVERALKERNQALIERREAAQRLRPPRLLRTAHAAHQHHRLCAIARRGRRRRAQRQAAGICRLRHEILGGAARHHQRHSGSGDDRRRRAGAAARGRRRRRGDEGRRRRHPGPAYRIGDRTCASSRPTASARSAPTDGACARSCSIFSPTRSASRRPARR